MAETVIDLRETSFSKTIAKDGVTLSFDSGGCYIPELHLLFDVMTVRQGSFETLVLSRNDARHSFLLPKQIETTTDQPMTIYAPLPTIHSIENFVNGISPVIDQSPIKGFLHVIKSH